VVLTYACDRPATLERLSTFWLPELRRLQVLLSAGFTLLSRVRSMLMDSSVAQCVFLMF
jgi:hypothetical protein